MEMSERGLFEGGDEREEGGLDEREGRVVMRERVGW